ncbi:MAG: endonuclease [Alicyclobacillus sp.]|nr:endonuclease [Alicyclobacillus sp.]
MSATMPSAPLCSEPAFDLCSPQQCHTNPSVHQLTQQRLLDVYERLFAHFGDRGWWPAATVEEVVIGAILVQNVAWSNVVRALEQLRQRDWLNFHALAAAPIEEVAACVVATRFYRMKAKKLKHLAEYIVAHYEGQLARMFAQPAEALRTELLALYGIGPETADDIVLYAAHQPTFVIDAYTRRIFARLGWIRGDEPYEDLRQWFLRHLPPDVPLYNQFHALIDALGHHLCSQRRPRCRECPLQLACGNGRTVLAEV